AEGVIRKHLIADKNYLDAVIGLPSNIFYGTSIPTVILVFKKSRAKDDDVLFIDSSAGFEKAKNQNYLRDSDVDKIIDTFRSRGETEKYSRSVSLKEIEENDYNLNIPRYVDTFEEEETVDLSVVVEELRKIEGEIKEVDGKIKEQCGELGIESPIF
nr:N-6 DNA methylase [Candidatus Delongbacteria bacterium]